MSALSDNNFQLKKHGCQLSQDFFLWILNNYFFGSSTNISTEIFFFCSHFTILKVQVFASQESWTTIFLSFDNHCYFKRKMLHQNGLSRVPVPSGENGFTLAHIKASFSEIADFPSSRKNTGPWNSRNIWWPNHQLRPWGLVFLHLTSCVWMQVLMKAVHMMKMWQMKLIVAN